jgi:hypothetical protein
LWQAALSRITWMRRLSGLRASILARSGNAGRSRFGSRQGPSVLHAGGLCSLVAAEHEGDQNRDAGQ